MALTTAGANRHDKKLLEPTLRSIVVPRPAPTRRHPQNLCLDAGYDYADTHAKVEALLFVAHIRPRYKEIAAKKNIPGFRARRWVVERSHSWFNRYRRLLVRWEKKVANYRAFLYFACGIMAFRAAEVFG